MYGFPTWDIVALPGFCERILRDRLYNQKHKAAMIIPAIADPTAMPATVPVDKPGDGWGAELVAAAFVDVATRSELGRDV